MCKVVSTTRQRFHTAGDLIRVNGALTPFTAKAREQRPSPSASATPNAHDELATSAAASVWPPTPQTSVAAAGAVGGGARRPAAAVESNASNEISQEALRALAAKERALAEEQRKLREKEEQMRREERAREDTERRMREMQLELQRQRVSSSPPCVKCVTRWFAGGNREASEGAREGTRDAPSADARV